MERPDPSNDQAAVRRHHRRCLYEMISGRLLLLPQKQATFEISAVGGGRKSKGDGGCFSLSAVTTSDVGVITLPSDAIILTAAVTSPTKSLEVRSIWRRLAGFLR